MYFVDQIILQLIFIDQINRLMLIREIIVIYSENHTKPLNTVRGQNWDLFNVKLSVTYSYHCALKD
jgi:hypothetical protein